MMPSMRVVYLSQHFAPDVAAAAQMVSDLGAALTAAGHDGTAISCDRSYVDPSTRYPLRETLRGMRIERVRSTGFGRARKIGRMADYATFLLGATRLLLFGKKPDVVISLSSPPMMALVGTLGARLRGARSIFWSMDVYPDVAFELGVIRRGGLVGRFFSFLAWLSLRTPDVVVALGDTMASRLSALGARNVEVIHNWAPVESTEATPTGGRMPSKVTGTPGKRSGPMAMSSVSAKKPLPASCASTTMSSSERTGPAGIWVCFASASQSSEVRVSNISPRIV